MQRKKNNSPPNECQQHTTTLCVGLYPLWGVGGSMLPYALLKPPAQSYTQQSYTGQHVPPPPAVGTILHTGWWCAAVS